MDVYRGDRWHCNNCKNVWGKKIGESGVKIAVQPSPFTDEEQVHFWNIWEKLSTAQVPIDANTLKVSIIMPTFRREQTIRNTISSILAQTYTNWELIIIDNEPGHTYNFNNPRIRYFQHTRKQSAAYARNKGVRYMTGDLVCFFDDDDTMEPNYLERMTNQFNNPVVQFVSCNIVYAGNNFIPPHYTFSTPTVMVREEFVTANWQSTDYGIAHDRMYFDAIRCQLQQGEYVEIEDILVRARGLAGGRRDPEGHS